MICIIKTFSFFMTIYNISNKKIYLFKNILIMFLIYEFTAKHLDVCVELGKSNWIEVINDTA